MKQKQNVIPHANPGAPQLKIQVPETVVNGTYSNFAIINHRKNEFVIDFIYMPPGHNHAKVVARQILNPENAKRLLMALNGNITKYEEKYGVIAIEEPPSSSLH